MLSLENLCERGISLVAKNMGHNFTFEDEYKGNPSVLKIPLKEYF